MTEHIARNRAYWDDLARQYVKAGERAWAQEGPAWGNWHVPEAELQIFSEQLPGKDAIELGCGTAYISAWLSRRGVRVVGIDNSKAQLDTARRLQRRRHLKSTNDSWRMDETYVRVKGKWRYLYRAGGLERSDPGLFSSRLSRTRSQPSAFT